jgi:adenylate cyclase
MTAFKRHARAIVGVRWLLSMVLVTVFALHVLGVVNIVFLQRLDYVFYDLRMRTSLSNEVDNRLVIVDLDEKSLAAEGRWPWSREKLSFLVDMLFDYYQVRLLGFDVVFSERDESINIDVAEKLLQRLILQDTPKDKALGVLRAELVSDARFADSLQGRPVVLGYFFSGEAEQSPGVLPAGAIPTGTLPFADWLPSAESFTGNLPQLQAAAASGGFINTPFPDQDGVLRSVPLLIRYQDKVYDSLAVAMLRQLFPRAQMDFHLAAYQDGGDARLESVALAGLTARVNQTSSVLVPFSSASRGYRYHSATDVLNAQVSPEALSDKIVLIGASAAGLSDFYPTPVSTSTAGVEIHANIIRGFLNNEFKARPGYLPALEWVQLLVLGLGVAVIFPLLHLTGMVVAFLGTLGLLVFANLLAWRHFDLAAGLASPLALLLLLFGLQLIFGYFFEIRRKNQLGQLFGHYIPPELVEKMSHSDEEFSIGGISREMTVLFSDIRGFTSLSENLDPEQLCDLINEIFTGLTREIQATRGTIDKYMGDAVMAFWGAPLNDEAHALHSIAAGLSMVQAIEVLNQSFVQRGRSEIRIGVGINTGKMSVGNMGSEFRMAYTVMGDAVNLASRLEGLTKSYGVYVIVSEFSRQAAPEFLYRELDRVRVKGKLEPITIYQPLCLLSQASADEVGQVEAVGQALQAYRAADWLQAAALFTTLTEAYPADRFYQIYLDRIAVYKRSPPADDWDGVFVHQTK